MRRAILKARHVGATLLIVAAATVVSWSTPALGQDELGRRQLEHEDYDAWHSIGRPALSNDGKWVAFEIRGAEDASPLTIRQIDSQKSYQVENGSRLQFSFDSRYAAYMVNPDPKLIKSLEEKDTPRSEMPRAKFELLDLENGRHVTIEDVRSFSMPEKASGWIAYSMVRPPEEKTVTEQESKIEEQYVIEGARLAGPPKAAVPKEPEEPEATEETQKPEEPKAKPEDPDDKENGTVLVLRELQSGIERRFPDVSSHQFGKYGKVMAFAASATDAEDDGVFVVDLASGSLSQVISGRGNYRSIAISEDETRVAFLSDRDDYGPVKPSHALYLWSTGDEEAAPIASEGADGIPADWWIASSTPTFTEDGRRLLFDTQPKPDDAGKTKKELERERREREREPQAVLDVWHWQDLELQPQQLVQVERERNRGYQALYDLEAKKIMQLATKEIPDVFVDPRSTADVAVGGSDRKYAVSGSWEAPNFRDSYLINLNTGEAELVLEKVRGGASLSPGGAFISWWDPDQEKQFVMSVDDREIIDASEGIPTSLANELHDTPSPPRSYGAAGWLDDDAGLLLYDRFDIWLVDPTGEEPTKCLTGELGRESETRYRYVRLDDEERSIDPSEPMMLSAFSEDSKASGYGTLNMESGEPAPLIMLDESVGQLQKAQEADTVVLTRQTFRRFPDLWASTVDFNTLTRLTDANPQQRDYQWGTAELIQYQSADGEPLDGLLYKPDNFDPNRKYPMMVYFYERNSDNLHRYYTPAAGSSSINYSFYVSRGYVLFVPDIPYDTGYPGESAANAVLPGVQAVVDLGFVDEDRIGVQGHSWGGYQIAYLVTMTNVFACAESGAPVSNMTSAYGGIRWASGLSRMFQYEKTQSRIGDTLWNARDLYIANSPVFHADKIETPLLILHNDEDGAVPWYQGIELFVAMRRLSKPAWLLNYNGEAHGLRREENREDFARRMQQFFDHYLLDAPAPVWLAEGIKAVEKGTEFGFEPAGVEKESPNEEPEEESGG